MKSDYIESNTILERIPDHLKQFIKPQNYDEYTAIDQAVWRFVMRKNITHLKNIAHASYLKGLDLTGISIDKIPNMYGMNRILKEIGWAAIAVDGFIPPSVFMEFQAYNVLVIASDIRQLDNMEYTPAPDIIHEAAGHAPIIANPEYAEYLRRFGEIGSKAISSAKDYDIYEAVRHLSIIKESADPNEQEILGVEKKIKNLIDSIDKPSEMSLIRNLHWWTVEYGLIGSLKTPKIYGAGLLSSIGESSWCLSESVEKITYTINAAYQNFDITKPQPRLYVTPDFAHLSYVLEEFANTMALRTGGLSGIQKLIESHALGTIELSTGIQVSGIFNNVISSGNKPVYFQTIGKTALSFRGKELINHGTSVHTSGFGSPIGKLKGINLAIEDMSPRDLKAYDIYESEIVELEFEGNITVKGQIITGIRNLQGKIILISFKNCSVHHNEIELFKPEWGQYDMAIGKNIISAFSGPGDLSSFNLITHELSNHSQNIKKSKQQESLENLYQNVRDFREKHQTSVSIMLDLFNQVVKNFTNEWLILIEMYELAQQLSHKTLSEKIIRHLEHIKQNFPKNRQLIDDGISIVQNTTNPR